MVILHLNAVSKRYETRRWALREVSFRQGKGVLGLVGPNGAGKTTLLRILATLLVPTEGIITWNTQDISINARDARRELGFLPQDFGVYPQLTAREFLQYIGTLKGLRGVQLQQRVGEVLEMVHLTAERDRRLRTFSGGMIRRIGIAQAFLNEPRLLILDEPTVGLDPSERVFFRQMVSGLQGDRLVILSTHIMSDVEAMATDLVLLQEGRLFWSGTPASLVADAEGGVWSATLPRDDLEALQAAYRLSSIIQNGDDAQVRILAHTRPVAAATPAMPTLEEAYLSLLNEPG